MIPRCITLLLASTAILFGSVACGAEPSGQIKVRISWGHRSPANTPFYVKLLARGVETAQATGVNLEEGEGLRDGAWQTRAGGGDVDGVEVVLRYAEEPPKEIANLNRIWADLIAQSDPDDGPPPPHGPGLPPGLAQADRPDGPGRDR